MMSRPSKLRSLCLSALLVASVGCPSGSAHKYSQIRRESWIGFPSSVTSTGTWMYPPVRAASSRRSPYGASTMVKVRPISSSRSCTLRAYGL